MLSVLENWMLLVSSIDIIFMGCDQEVMFDWLLVLDCDFDIIFVVNVCDGEDFIFQGVVYVIGIMNIVQGNSV